MTERQKKRAQAPLPPDAGRIVVTERENVLYYGYYRGDTPVELYLENVQEKSLVGNIYAARVERCAPGIGGAFLEIGEKGKCYYRLSPAKKPLRLSPGHEDRLCGGDVLLVQIAKDAVKTKLPVASGDISFSGTFCVLTLPDQGARVSKKIPSGEERRRLAAIAKAEKPPDCGLILRTNAAGVPEEILREEIASLSAQFQSIRKKAAYVSPRTLLWEEPPGYLSLMRELPAAELAEAVTDSRTVYERLLSAQPGCPVRLCEDAYPLYLLYRMEHHYEAALHRLVHLKSGGSLVIEPTEAMTVIDVNTGAVTKGRGKGDTVYRQTNLEAAEEIARQLRLRNLSGIVVIDFINLKSPAEEKELLDCLQMHCARDRIRCQVVDMTALGLVELTRSKQRRPLHEQAAIAGISFGRVHKI